MNSTTHLGRSLQLGPLVKKNTFFLFGPRSTGKTSLIKVQLPDALILDLLDFDTYEELLRRPKAISEKLRSSKQLVVIDEIQKLPILLDEVHRLIEKNQTRFLLTGSSARKLKRGGANMLGGRAREAQLNPLAIHEIENFNLMKFLNFGGLPKIYLSDEPTEDLQAYVRVYLNEEIKAEAAVRNYERFVRFLETLALCNAQEINYAQLSSDSGVPARTIEGHIEVLKDTLIGFELKPFEKTLKRKATSKSKFYFFDTGVANYLANRLPLRENHADCGTAFEQMIIQEVRSYLAYSRKMYKLFYWRSKGFEVDLIIGQHLAIEIKFAKHVQNAHLNGLKALKEENLIQSFLLVGRFTSPGTSDGIRYLGYEDFVAQLWSHQLI